VRTFHGPVEKIESQLRDRATLVYLIEYSDGLRATVTKVSGVTHEFAVACRLRQREASVAWWFRLAENPNGHFEHLLRAIEPMVHTGKPSYPVKRTLLTTDILDRMMHSQHQQGKRLLSPELDIGYQPSSWGFANREEENFPKSSKS